MQHTWRVLQKESGRLKVVTTIVTEKGNRVLSLGQFLMNPPKGKMVYPRRFQDGLDYRKSNLIVCTMAERQRLLPKTRGEKSSQFKGVSYSAKQKKWRASIRINGKGIALGTFETELEAAKAYNKAAKEHFGDIGYQNQIVPRKNIKRPGDD
ncbi:AP2 domain-containing protein [Bdellovibrio svalbardensis]|uniref:AP2 domain-containing protein n=1 Tax=Bdellovibrio svalbardensis TaxID=2972972 RepID=A0ABT6DFN8_9BACT|nr:AP2 domain-containing protein [Bdellovibrio svalbardensis]MDG0814759.1 AP2 domain-containing protein [Bdellovibrio svalbardensis]